MSNRLIHTLDLNFLGTAGAIAAYLIPHKTGCILIECGPGSTQATLKSGLEAYGYSLNDITDVFLTHIHLDHAGAAGWLARHGARIHVHPNGAPHLTNPEKLLASAARIYGEMMDTLWGEFLSVPADKLSVLSNNQILDIGDLRIRAIDTPGHANHHFAYLINGVCFSGDIGGVRLRGLKHLRLPMPPPELQLENWRSSIQRLRHEKFSQIAPTHFGIYSDPGWHLDAVDRALNEVEVWIDRHITPELHFDELNESFLKWIEARSLREGLSEAEIQVYELANPSWMSSYGIQRYWRKYRSPTP